MAVRHVPCLLTLKKVSSLSRPSAYGNFFISPTWNTRLTTGCRARSTPWYVHRNLFWQPWRNGILHGSSISHAMTASPKPSFRVPWRVGNTVVMRGNTGWTTSKNGHPCPYQNCLQGPPAEQIERGSLLNCPSCPLTTKWVKRLNWTELNPSPRTSPLLRPFLLMYGSCKGPNVPSDSVVQSDQLLQETNGADQWNQFWNDFTGPLFCFPVVTDRIARLNHKVDWGLGREVALYFWLFAWSRGSLG